MAESGALERVLEELIQRVLDSRLASLRQDLRGEIADALARLPRGEAPVATAGPGLSALNQSVSRILQPTGQSEIMAAFLQSAAGFAGRCALFVQRGETFAFWRAEGFPDQAIGSLRSVTVPLSEPGIFKDLCETQQAFSSQRSPAAAQTDIARARYPEGASQDVKLSATALPPGLAQALGDSAEPNVHLFPVVVRGRVVAVLYADAGTRAGSAEPSALEVLARVAGLSLETAAGRAAPPAPPVAVAAPPEMAPAPPEAPAEPVPQEVAAAPEAVSVGEPGPPPGSFAASVPAAAEGAAVLPPPPETDSLPPEDREAHRKAHRFARVAVQDLLSYHKGKIEGGRKKKNLYQIIKEDIDKTRQNYQARFGGTAARSFDYLHYELVLKLAGNDPSALGEQYPGPTDAE